MKHGKARDIITDAKESGDNTELKDYAKEKNMTIAEVKEMANCVDSSFNSSQYTAFANSLVTVEYFEGSGDSMTTQRASSATGKEEPGQNHSLLREAVKTNGVLVVSLTLMMKN